MSTPTYRLVVINQTQPPVFQEMVERLASQWGPCLLLTGTPFHSDSPHLHVRQGPPYNRSSKLHRATSWLGFTAWATKQILSLQGRPFLWAVTNPPLLPPLTWALSRLKDYPFGLLIWDIYPDHLVKIGWLKPDGFVTRQWNALNARIFTDAKFIITLGERMATTLQSCMPSFRPIDVVPNWVDCEEYRPINKLDNPFVAQHDLQDKLVVMYSGNMGGSHGMEIIADTARLLQHREDIQFVLIGDGMGRKVLEDAKKHHSLNNMTLLPYQPWDVVPFSLASADIALVTQAPGTEHLSVPSKTYTMMAAGAAVIAITNLGSDLDVLIGDSQFGLSRRHDPGEVAQAIETLAARPHLRTRMQKNARKTAERRFNQNKIDIAFQTILAKAIA